MAQEKSKSVFPGAGIPVTKNVEQSVLSPREIWRQPMPFLAHEPLSCLVLRLLLRKFGRYICGVSGLEHVGPEKDPFILALNHNQRMEAVLVPSFLIFKRQGKLVHFLSDWNFRMIPGLAFILRRSQTIVLMNKPARPRFLNVLKPLFAPRTPGWVRAADKLKEGGAVGVFTEGTINRDPSTMLRGHTGAARLSLLTRTPVVPAGIWFPDHQRGQPISDRLPMQLDIGEAMPPPPISGEPSLAMVRQWHEAIMRAISGLCHKAWDPHTKRRP